MGAVFVIFGNFGKLFFTNAVLAGVASSCVCAGEETKSIESETKKEEFIPKGISLIKELDQENLNKEENKDESEKRIIYALKVLTAVGFISVFLLFLGQRYLKYKALKKVDDSWKAAKFIYFVGEMLEASGEYKKLKTEEKKVNFLANLKYGVFEGLVSQEIKDLYTSIMKEKSFRNIFWNLKSAAEIRALAKKDEALFKKLEKLKYWGNILNKVEAEKKKGKKLSLNKQENTFLAKLRKLEGADVLLDLMGINSL